MSGIVVHEKKLPHYGAAFMLKKDILAETTELTRIRGTDTPVPARPGTGAGFYRTSGLLRNGKQS